MPAAGDPVDVLIVSLGSTHGLRMADEQLREALQRAGASVAVAQALPRAQVRTMMLTDLGWARAARAGARRVLEAYASPPRAIVYSSTTAALLWPHPGAIRFDAPAAGNRRGRDGLWQRPLEHRRMAQTRLLLPWSAGALAEAHLAPDEPRALVLPVAVEPSGPPAAERDIAAITYAANPLKKGLDRVLAAWRRVRGEDASAGELWVAGASREELRAVGLLASGEPGVRIVGRLAREEYRALLRRARAFVCAPRREDYGIAQLEALADGCRLVSTAAPGPYAALPIARELDGRLVGDDLARALRIALEEPPADYEQRAALALAPFSPAAVEERVARELMPRLLGEAAQLGQ